MLLELVFICDRCFSFTISTLFLTTDVISLIDGISTS